MAKWEVQIWQEAADAAQIISSAKEAIAGILRMGPSVLAEHKKALIARMIWKITEAHGKYNTRYCSKTAQRANKEEKRHDHIYPLKRMVERILANHSSFESEIANAIGCTV